MDLKRYWTAIYCKAAELAGGQTVDVESAPEFDLDTIRTEARRALAGKHDQSVVLSSLATPDGGVAGRTLEADLLGAAKMIVDKRAVPATPEQAEEFRAQRDRERERIRKENEARKLHIQVVEQSAASGFSVDPEPVAQPAGRR